VHSADVQIIQVKCSQTCKFLAVIQKELMASVILQQTSSK